MPNKSSQKKILITNTILAVFVIILAFAPLVLKRNAEFQGADVRASDLISTINANYKPWFKPIWKPPSAEVETFIFALQAAIGAGFIGYFLGYSKGKKEK